MFLRAFFLSSFVFATIVVAAPTDEEVGRKIAIMEIGSRPAAARDPLSVLAAPVKPPVLYPAFLPLADEDVSAAPVFSGDDSLLSARWYHILGLGEQLKNERAWTEVTTVDTTRRPLLPLREKP